jgi:hypothetical protein
MYKYPRINGVVVRVDVIPPQQSFQIDQIFNDDVTILFFLK